MLLRVGLVTVTFSVLLATGVILVVSLRAEAPAAQGAWARPAAAEPVTRDNGFDPGEKLEIDDESGGASTGKEPRKERPGSRSKLPPRGENSAPSAGGNYAPSRETPAPGQRDPKPLSVSDGEWPLPTRGELSQIVEHPRYFGPDPDAAMTLTIEALGLYDVPVFDSLDEEALDRGLMHVPDTAYPWDDGDQKNVFLAGHRVGLPGTNGRLLFFALDELGSGDEIVLEDRDGNAYTYRVQDIFKVETYDAWVADTLADRDLLTLQTCTYPTFEDRLIVRANRA